MYTSGFTLYLKFLFIYNAAIITFDIYQIDIHSSSSAHSVSFLNIYRLILVHY
nr:MAG TPA: hypothetical protein [Caudoviricetes sp.]